MGAIKTIAKTSLLRKIRARCMDLTVNQWLVEFDSQVRSKEVLIGGSSGLRFSLARRMSRRVRFSRSPPIYLCKALSGCVHRLGRCGEGSNPSTETSYFVPPWCNGNTTGFELVILGSIPSGGASFRLVTAKTNACRRSTIFFLRKPCGFNSHCKTTNLLYMCL